MDNESLQTGAASGSRRLGIIVVVLAALAVAAFGTFYMLRSGTVGTEEMTVEDIVTGEEAVVEDIAAEEPSLGEAVSAGAPALLVSIKDFKFAPEVITINAGESVTWKNDEAGVPHRIALDNGSYMSAAVFAGESEVRRFPVAGTFPYHCSIHPSMKGTVVVE